MWPTVTFETKHAERLELGISGGCERGIHLVYGHLSSQVARQRSEIAKKKPAPTRRGFRRFQKMPEAC
jgi:hypothetical protein